jgi:hypothetical protein
LSQETISEQDVVGAAIEEVTDADHRIGGRGAADVLPPLQRSVADGVESDVACATARPGLAHRAGPGDVRGTRLRAAAGPRLKPPWGEIRGGPPPLESKRRREAGGASRSVADKIRDGREPQDRQGAWP